ncbi:MAG: hypothetical protein H6733_09230 [Alphaproteobacteria bacterium]|nr:hypothetical protein [Alphaproteobacteria bacterium]
MRARLTLLPLLAACTGAPATDDADDTDVAPVAYDAPGPYVAGARSMDVLGPEGLVLTTEVWFPAERDTGAPYAYLGVIQRDAVANATPACDTPRPVAVFSHGNTGLRFQSIFLSEHLASHGWVVAAPDHKFNTTFDTDTSRTGEVALRRPGDVAAVYDALLADPTLLGCVDPDAGYVAIGHSFGGWTALATAGATLDLDHLTVACGDDRGWMCQVLLEATTGSTLDLSDPRVTAAVAMAPSGYETFGPDGMATLAVPTLILGGSEDDLTPWDVQQVPMLEGMSATAPEGARLEGASHYSFSDACALAPVDPYCDGSLGVDEAHRLINGLTTAFLEDVAGRGQGADLWLPPDDARVTWWTP